MNLKSKITKIIASITMAYLVLGNLAVPGIGISKIIAEEVRTPNLKIEGETTKYIQYAKENNVGTILGQKINIWEDCTNENYLPILNMQVKVTVPTINEQKPSKVSIIKTNTYETTGKEDEEIIGTYNAENGIVEFNYKNNPDDQGNIYSQYKENAKDEFEIIYIFKTQNANEIAVETRVEAQAEYKSTENTISTQKVETIKNLVKQNIGEITSYELIKSTPIYKGFMYANEKNNTNYSTDYEITSNLEILNSEITDEIKIDLEKSNFVNSKNEIIETDKENYTTTTINEKNFKKVFGEDGYVEIYLGENKYATVKYIQTGENKAYATVYEQEENNSEAGKIIYPENTTNVTIKTSKPIAEGNVKIKNQKTIKASNTYELPVSEITSITEASKIAETKEDIKKIVMQEPKTQMNLELSNNNFSTLVTNKTTLTLKLDDTNNTCNLFTAGQISIKLPDNLESSKILSANALYTNGLTVENARIENNNIIVTITGEQKEYDLENQAGGVNIVIEIETDIADTTPTHTENIEVLYNNTKLTKTINVISKQGVLILNKVAGYDDENAIYTSSDETVIAKISETKGRNINQYMTVVNNYDYAIENLEITGILGDTSKYKSTFNPQLVELNVLGIQNYKVYYTDSLEKVEWKEQATNETKAYKILIDKIESKQKLDITQRLLTESNIGYNQQTIIRTNMKYTANNIAEQRESSYALYTEKKEIENQTNEKSLSENISVDVQTKVGNRNLGEEAVNEGQIIEFKVKVSNNTETDLLNYSINTKLENAIYYELVETGKEYNIEGDTEKIYKEADEKDVIRSKKISIPAKTYVEYTYKYIVNKNVSGVNNILQIADENQNVVYNFNKQNQVQKADLQLKFEYAYSDQIPIEGYMSNILIIKNYSNQDINDLVINVATSKELVNGEIELLSDYGEVNEETVQNQEAGITPYVVSIPAGKEIYLGLVYDLDIDTTKTEAPISLIATTNYQNHNYTSNNLEKTAVQTKTNLNLEVTNNLEKTTVKQGQEIIYNAKITNSGVIDLEDISFSLEPGEGIEYKSGTIEHKDGTKENLIIEDPLNITTDIKIAKNDEINVVLKTVVTEEAQGEIETGVYLMDDNFNTQEKTFTITVEEPSETDDIDDIDTSDANTNTNNQQTSQENNNTANNEKQENANKKANTIAGTAWLDENKDGIKGDNEKTLKDITVKLINSQTGEYVKNSKGKVITEKTNKKGEYKFKDVENGKYIVTFEFNTDKYKLTTYKNQIAEESKNSKVVVNTMKIEGTEEKIPLTDAIEINTNNVENINIGLIEKEKFDLKLNKYISSISVINPKTGAITKQYKDKETAKIKLTSEELKNSELIVTYKFQVTNTGEIAGYANKIKSEIPEGLTFISDLNKQWYQSEDGNLYTQGLNNEQIGAGETKEIELILTKKPSEDTGKYNSNSDLVSTSNAEAIEETSQATKNNHAASNLIIAKKTPIIIYIIATTISISIIGIAAYEINKKYLQKGEIK